MTPLCVMSVCTPTCGGSCGRSHLLWLLLGGKPHHALVRARRVRRSVGEPSLSLSLRASLPLPIAPQRPLTACGGVSAVCAQLAVAMFYDFFYLVSLWLLGFCLSVCRDSPVNLPEASRLLLVFRVYAQMFMWFKLTAWSLT